MKAKYLHQNGVNTEYVICVDNLVTQISGSTEYNECFIPESYTEQFTTVMDAQRAYHAICERLESRNYKCIYKEVA